MELNDPVGIDCLHILVTPPKERWPNTFRHPVRVVKWGNQRGLSHEWDDPKKIIFPIRCSQCTRRQKIRLLPLNQTGPDKYPALSTEFASPQCAGDCMRGTSLTFVDTVTDGGRHFYADYVTLCCTTGKIGIRNVVYKAAWTRCSFS